MIKIANSGYGVNFNQLIQNNNFNGTTNWGGRWYPTTLVAQNNILTATAGTQYPNLTNISQTVQDYVVGHKYLAYAEIRNNDTDTNRASFAFGDTFPSYQTITSSFSYIYYFYTVSTSIGHYFGIMAAGTDSSVQSSVQVRQIGLIDLTDAFGSGNEPTTVAEFREMYPDDYYDYVSSQWQWSKNNYVTSYPTPVIENGITLLPIESKKVGIIKPELSNISLIRLKSGSYKNTADNGPYVTVSDGNEITINTPSTDANYGITIVPFISAFVSAKTLKAGHTYYWFIDGEKRSGDWNCIVVDYSNKHLDAYFLYAGNINTFTPETDVTITSVRVYLANSSKHYDNYKIKLIITENQQYLIDKGIISQ